MQNYSSAASLVAAADHLTIARAYAHGADDLAVRDFQATVHAALVGGQHYATLRRTQESVARLAARAKTVGVRESLVDAAMSLAQACALLALEDGLAVLDFPHEASA